MDRRVLMQGIGAAALMPVVSGLMVKTEARGEDAKAGVVFELRVYHANEGKLDALLARFRDHTVELFKKHGMRSVAYWTPTDEPLKGKTLIYILQHPSREAAMENWKSFHDDPDWMKVAAASEVNGKLVDKVDSTYMVLTDFSAVP